MKVLLAIIAGFIVWGVTTFLLTEFVDAMWRMSGPFGVFVENWFSSIVGLTLARDVAKRISLNDGRAEAYMICMAAALLTFTLVMSPLGSLLTWATLGGLLACLIEWRTSTPSFRR